MEPFSPSPSDTEPRHTTNPSHWAPFRTRIKVFLQDLPVGRSVDLMEMDDYDHLVDTLDEMFELDGVLRSCDKWQIIYTDNEGDMMLIGDVPWPEFRNVAKRLFICLSQDVKRWTR